MKGNEKLKIKMNEKMSKRMKLSLITTCDTLGDVPAIPFPACVLASAGANLAAEQVNPKTEPGTMQQSRCAARCFWLLLFPSSPVL